MGKIPLNNLKPESFLRVESNLEKMTVGTWVSKQMVDDIKAATVKGGYINQADFIRQAIREKLEDEKQ